MEADDGGLTDGRSFLARDVADEEGAIDFRSTPTLVKGGSRSRRLPAVLCVNDATEGLGGFEGLSRAFRRIVLGIRTGPADKEIRLLLVDAIACAGVLLDSRWLATTGRIGGPMLAAVEGFPV